MLIEEIIKELESISYQLDSTSNGYVENDSDLSGAKSDLNYLTDTLEKEMIAETKVPGCATNNVSYGELQIDGC